ncbi:MAG: ribonuclease R [Bacillota bacterium]
MKKSKKSFKSNIKQNSTKKKPISGIIRTSGRGFGFFIPDDKEVGDVFVPPKGMNTAMNNDEVLLRITRSVGKTKKSEGEIVKIVKRSNTKIVGVFKAEANYGILVSDDSKLSDEIFVSKAESLGAKDGQKVVAEITVWPERFKNAQARIIEILGYPGDVGIDVMSVIRSFGIETEFPNEVLAQAEKIPETISEETIASEISRGRRDLRKDTLVTIDGEDAKDLDDAVSVELIKEGPNAGNFLLGVHIADVSHYVSENSAIDKEALSRGTSVYFVDRVVPMLPERLSNGICSLNPNVNRLAFSVTMTIHKDTGAVIAHEIFESIIATRERMTYTNVKKILDGEDTEVRERYKPLIPLFERMRDLRNILLERRTKRGAIEFEFAEAKVIVDDKGKAIDIVKREMTIATSIIEEFMIAANESVAEHFCTAELPFLYRVHEDPNAEKVKMFAQFASNLGYKMEGVDSPKGIHPRAYQKLLFQAKGKKEEKIISTIMLRSLQKARYSSNHDKHFGLAAEFYSHFTSPIRRYPDLQIHRLMKEYLAAEGKGAGAISATRLSRLERLLPDVALQTSLRERVAEDAERAVEEKKKVEYMARFVGEEFDAVISSVTGFGFFVELENTCEGLVHVNSLGDDYFVFEENKYRLIGERTRKIFAIGDLVRVTLARADAAMGKLDFELVVEKT